MYRVPGEEELCMTLRRRSYPNSMCELKLLFNRHNSVILSVVSTVLAHVRYSFNHLLADLTTHRWLNVIGLENFSEDVHAKSVVLESCWGFPNSTAREICRPSVGLTEKLFRTQETPCAKVPGSDVPKRHSLPNGLVCDYIGADPPSLDEYLMPSSI
ncbi:hypothetical protein MRX96_028513 [Rhipicephalus microplus]